MTDAPAGFPHRWLPVDIRFDSGEGTVKWLHFGSTSLAAPFFNHTVRWLTMDSPPAAELMTQVEVLLDVAARLPAVTPAGIIFHVSRCGSTYLGNALRTAGQVVVLSEVCVIGMVSRPGFFHGTALPRDQWNNMRRRLLDAVIRVYGHHDVASDPRVIIKWIPFGLLQMDVIRDVWPTVPFAVLIRDPLEVMVSNLERPPETFVWPSPAREGEPLEEYYARGLGLLYAAARQRLDGHALVVDYEQLSPEMVQRIASFFGITLTPGSDALRAVMATYSKDPSRVRQFSDDREHKRRHANDLVKQSAARWADPPYIALKNEVALR
jgi:hypothetical protein